MSAESRISIPEAPIDGSTYGRKDAGWAVAGGGGGIKQAYNQGSAPTASDDSTQGYAAGSRWYGQAGEEWFCASAGAGVAVWQQIFGEVSGQTTGVGQAVNATTSGTAVGSQSHASNDGVGVGYGASGLNGAIAIGAQATADSDGSVAIGTDSSANGATVPNGWTDTVQLGRGTASLEKGLNFLGLPVMTFDGVSKPLAVSKASLPSVSANGNTNGVIVVTDAVFGLITGRTVCISNGSDWINVQTGLPVV